MKWSVNNNDKLVKNQISMAKKKDQIQGAQILCNDPYLTYFKETKDVAQRRSWTFPEAIKKEIFHAVKYYN